MSLISCSVSSAYPIQWLDHLGLDQLQALDVEAALGEDRRQVPAAGDPVLVHPVAELVLAVGGLHGGQRGRLGGPLDDVLLELDQRVQPFRGDLAGGQHAQLVPHAGDPLPQRAGGPGRRGGRVVQLVHQAG
jgi:hypothetical protein